MTDQRAGNLERRALGAGMKMTAQRRVVLQVLEGAEDHPSVDDVYRRAKDLDRSISIATVYRTLHLLDELSLIQKHDFTNQTFARFEANLEHHHHLIDVETGEVLEFQDDELEVVKSRIADELGFELIDHRLELYGRKKRG